MQTVERQTSGVVELVQRVQCMERGMRQKSRRRNSSEHVKIMIELEIELENELENELEIELEQGQEFGDHETMTTRNTLKHSMEQAVLDFAEGIVLSVSEIFDRQLRENVPVLG